MRHAGVAQLVEQLICNQQVGGSSPSTSSTISASEYGRFPEWPKGADCKSVVNDFGGSNPPPPTRVKSIARCSFFMAKNVASRGIYNFYTLLIIMSKNRKSVEK